MSSSVISANGLEAGPPGLLASTFAMMRLEDVVQLVARLLHAQADEAEARPLVEDDDQDHALPTIEMWMLAFSPSWNWVANSFSPISLARPPVAAMLPAVSEASDVVSMFSISPWRGDELAVLVDDEDDLGVRVRAQLDEPLDLVELLFVHHDIGRRHSLILLLAGSLVAIAGGYGQSKPRVTAGPCSRDRMRRPVRPAATRRG